MIMNPVGWFEIYVQDMNRAKSFYEGVFQTKLEKIENPEIDMWSFPFSMEEKLPGAAGALVKMEGVPSGGGGTLVYFSCKDCANEAKKVEENGGKIMKPKFSIGQFGFISIVFDTEGNMIGLHSMV